jgi:hypothetical protein
MKHGLHIMLQRLVRSTVSAAPVLDRAGAVAVDLIIFSASEVAAKKEIFDSDREIRVGREHIFKRAVFFTYFAHQYPALLLNDLRPYLAGMARRQHRKIGFTADDGISHFRNASRAERVGNPRKTQRRGRALIALEHPSGRPFRLRQFPFRKASVDALKELPGQVRK